ncbi:AraC family transcriptional regulator [uncultured Lacinutrix sp.]|uniref:helix-turn-helix domain-containing protein n=1 Tax=uncultured Lacinutrix sp. TaxID=574032 RepID=UPI00263A1752|nr:helix-turn-helix domain-containing protein [uncultured Lacinutrix sp.]
MNFWETIFLFFAFLSFLLSFLFFFKKKGDRIANVILGVYLLLFSLNLVYNVLYWTKKLFTATYINFFGLLVIIWAAYSPLMYLYTKHFLNQNKLKKRDIFHLFGPLLMVVLYSRFFLLNSKAKGQALLNANLYDYIYLGKYIHAIIACIMIFYLAMIYNAFSKNKSLEINKKRWLKWVVIAFSSYVLAMLAYFTLSYFQLITTDYDYFIMYTIIFFIALVAYFGFMQPEVFNGLSMDKILPFKKYQKTGLSKSLSIELKEQLIEVMNDEKPHLNSELRLSDLAERLNVSKHHMSQIINEHFDSNFFFFINTYRIAEAKMLLKNNNDLNITDVIYSSGFNNRVSFYNAFKTHTGTTPTQFKLQSI